MAGGPITPNLPAFALPAGFPVNVVWPLTFNMPETIPTGIMKLQLEATANASAGVVPVSVADAAISAGSNPSTAPTTTETTVNVTWSAAGVLIVTKIPLTAAPVADQLLVVNVTFLNSATLAANSQWSASIIWE